MRIELTDSEEVKGACSDESNVDLVFKSVRFRVRVELRYLELSVSV